MENQKVNEDSIDIVAIINLLWRKHRLIFWGTGLITGSTLIIASLLPNIYESRGFYEAAMPALFYKTNYSALANVERFHIFLGAGKIIDPESTTVLRDSYKESSALSGSISPVFDNLTKESPAGTEGAANLLGFKIFSQDKNPNQARKAVSVLGAFIQDTFLYETLYTYISSNLSASADTMRNVDGLILENKFKETQLLTKKAELQQLKKSYPSAAIEIRQVFSTKGEGYQYLSPLSEAIKTEISISDLKIERTKLLRDREIAEIEYSFFTQARYLLKESQLSGAQVFDKILDLKNQFFKNQDLTKDTVKTALNTLPSDLETLNKTISPDIRLSDMHFVSGPTMPTRKVGPHRSLILLESFFTSLFTLTLLALILGWWENNKSLILSPIDPPSGNLMRNTARTQPSDRNPNSAEGLLSRVSHSSTKA